jgi:hypothetical protein
VSAVFSELLPEELLYSALARYADMMRFPRQKAVLGALFGRSTGVAVVELPGPINALVARLPAGHGWTAERLLDHHTTLPYYARFTAPHRIAEASGRLRVRGSAGLAESLGIRASGVPIPPHLRYCRECALRDRAVHGCAYWRRAHQLPGVHICPDHGTALWQSTISRRPAGGRHVFQSLEGAGLDNGMPLRVPLPDAAQLVRLAKDTLWLLTHGRMTASLAALHAKYRAYLREGGWLRSKMQIRMGDLRDAFIVHHGRARLRSLGCSLDTLTGEDDWFSRLLRRPRAAQHPLHHLLVIEFLGCTVDEFFSTPALAGPCPSGSVSVPCPNPVCQETASPKLVSERERALRCVRCGCTYRPATGGGTAVLAYRFLWEARLRDLVADRCTSLRGIARALGVTAKTVQRHALRLGVWREEWDPSTKSSPSVRATSTRAATERHRAEWLRHRTEHPDAGVKELRALAPAAYAHLYRCDRGWLAENRPKQRRSAPPARVDWTARDRETCALAEAAIAQIRALPGRPTRITRSGVAARTGRASLVSQHLNRLPLTAACIARAEESRTAHARRKLRWAEATYRAEGALPAPWEVVRRAALRPDLAAELNRDIVAVVHRLARLCTNAKRAA